YIVVCFPFQASAMCNVSRARKVIIFLLLLMLALNAHFFWTAELVDEHGWIICRGGKDFQKLVEEIWPWVDFLVYSFLPFVTIMILNIFIIREVASARSTRGRLAGSEQENHTPSSTNVNTSGNSSQRKTPASDGTRLTALLLTVSFTFLLLTLPNNIALIVSRFWNQKYENKTDHLTADEMRAIVHGMARFKLVMTITELLMYTNHSINFFLYCATGNKFRQQIFDLLRCLRRPRQPHTHVENTGFTNSVSRSNHCLMVVKTNSMAMTRRTPEKKSSSMSTDDEPDKDEDNKFVFEENVRACTNGNVENRFHRSSDSVDMTKSKDSLQDSSAYSYQNSGKISTFENDKRNSVKDHHNRKSFENKGSPFLCKRLGNSSHDKSGDVISDSSVDRHCKPVANSSAPWKVYNSKKKQKQSVASKRGSFGTDCDLSSNDSEYILLQPTIRWCDSATQS
ncbi:unnamed protein product, partial [Candidula unifasciata]